jgi:hypothetical protein
MGNCLLYVTLLYRGASSHVFLLINSALRIVRLMQEDKVIQTLEESGGK